MMNEEQQVEVLKSENFTGESALGRQNQRMVHKMFRYIRSFPFKEYEVEMMKKDIIGMAAEAEKRGEMLTAVIGEEWKKFCDQLIDAMTDFEFPKGRKLLRAAGIYHAVVGYYLIVNSVLGVVMFIPEILRSGQAKDILLSAVTWLFGLAIGILQKNAGMYGMRYYADAAKADTCLKWGYGMLALLGATCIGGAVLSVLSGLPSGYIPGQLGFLSNWLVVLFKLCFVGLFIVGAKKNRTVANG